LETYLRIEFFNFDEIYKPGLEITNSKPLERGQFTERGLFSKEIFGNLKSNRYLCSCGELKGKFQEGKLCPTCGETVNKKKSIHQVGWIHMGDEYLIQPIFYNFLSKLMAVEKIINFILHVDEDGEEENPFKGPYDNIGMTAFKENFDEILDYYGEKATPKKKKFYTKLKAERKNIFVNKILVFNIALRPAMVMGESNLRFDEINTFLTSIIKTLEILKEGTVKDEKEKFRLPLLFQCQLNYNLYAATIIKNISGKNGIIRNNLLGFRTNFSSRSTIIPMGRGGKITEVEMPYLGFLELYKFQILNLITRIYNVSYPSALEKWHKAVTNYDEEIMGIMNELVKSGSYILLNRNPTINYGSILFLRIKKVKIDPGDYTLSIHNTILPFLAGDFDGDVLNITAIMDNEFKEFFAPLSPRNMVISSDLGFNNQLEPQRDMVMGIHALLD